MTAVQTAIDIRSMTVDDVPAVLDLLRSSLAGGPTGERSRRFFEWKHLDNPFGPSLALVAEADGRIVGLRTFMRWRFRAGGRTVEAVRAVDTATHPDLQGRGIFRELTMTALDLARSEGVEFVFNTPNGKSLPGYLKMGWSTVGTVPIAIRPIRPLRFAARLRTASRGAPAGPDHDVDLPSADELLATHPIALAQLLDPDPDDDRLTTDRSLDYLRWRYAAAPDLGYRAIAEMAGGAMVGVAIGRARSRGELREFTLSEILVGPGDRRGARRVLRAATRVDCDHVATHLAPGTPSADVGLRSGYLQGRRFAGMTLVANPLVPSAEHALKPERWRLALGDLEVF